MRRQVAWLLGAVLLAGLGGTAAAVVEETTIVAQVSAADHEVEDGYFSLGDGATVIARPGSELHRFLTSHRGQKVRLVIEGTRDGVDGNPQRGPGSGRDSGQTSRVIPR